MTKGSTKDECNAVMESVVKAHQGKPWFIKAFVESDDHGLCVGVKVVNGHPEREPLARNVGGVKVVTYLVG